MAIDTTTRKYLIWEDGAGERHIIGSEDSTFCAKTPQLPIGLDTSAKAYWVAFNAANCPACKRELAKLY